MGGKAKNPRQSNAARNVAKAGELKASGDYAALRESAVQARNARKKNMLVGGPEFWSTLGKGSPMLGVNAA